MNNITLWGVHLHISLAKMAGLGGGWVLNIKPKDGIRKTDSLWWASFRPG